MKIVPSLLLLIFFSIEAHAAKYYKWQDEQGITHYTSIAPGNTASESINTRTGELSSSKQDASVGVDAELGSNRIPSDTPTSTRDRAENKTEDKTEKPETAPPTRQELAKAQEQKDKNCDIARQNFETLSTRPRVLINDPDTGERRYLTPDEQIVMKEGAQKHIDEHCR